MLIGLTTTSGIAHSTTTMSSIEQVAAGIFVVLPSDTFVMEVYSAL